MRNLQCRARLPPDAVRARPLDADSHQVTDPRRGTRQVHDHVAARAARQLGGAPPARGVHQNLDVAPHQPGVERGLNLPLQGLQRHDPPCLFSLVHIVGQTLGSQRVRTRRILEREHAVVPHQGGERERRLEVLVGLAGEPHDHIGRQRHVRQRLANPRDEIQIALARVAAAHRFQHPRRAGLHRQMQVPAHFWERRHRVEQPRANVPWVRTRKPNALDALDVVNRLQQPREVARRIIGGEVVIHDLPEELHFAPPAVGRLADLRHNVGLGPHPFVTAGVRHDTEAAELVAPFDNRHVGLDRIAAPGHAQREGDVLVRVEVDKGDGSPFAAVDRQKGSRPPLLGRLLHQHRQAPDGLRPDNDVGNAGRTLEQRLPLLLRDAPGDGDDRVVPAVGGELPQLPQARVELLFGALADAARVDHHEVGVRRIVGCLEAGLLEETRHPLGIMEVHLAAECFDEVLAGHLIQDATTVWPWFLRFRLSTSIRLSPSRPDRRQTASSWGEKPGADRRAFRAPSRGAGR